MGQSDVPPASPFHPAVSSIRNIWMTAGTPPSNSGSYRETKENVHRLLSMMVRIVRNLHQGYHAIIPVHREPIRYHQEALAPVKRAQEH
jgi:hypothetical protein